MFLYAIEAEFHPASNRDYLKSFTRCISTEFGVFLFTFWAGFQVFVNICHPTGQILMFLYAIEAEFHPTSNGDDLKSFTRGISTEFGVFHSFSAGFSHFCNTLLSTKQTIDHTEML